MPVQAISWKGKEIEIKLGKKTKTKKRVTYIDVNERKCRRQEP